MLFLNKLLSAHPNFFQTRLFMFEETYQAFLNQIFLTDKSEFFEMPSYAEISQDYVNKISQSDPVNLTTQFSETDISVDSIAFHRIEGTIFCDYDRWGWWFSTMQFMDDLRAADENPKIIAHFILVKSGGGEAYYLEQAALVMKNLKKPVIAYTMKYNCSAALFLSCYADKLYAATEFDVIGSIGTMVSFFNFLPYYEKLGIKQIEEYSNYSPLKNQKYRDLRDGKPKQYIKEELDPLAENFIATVKDARSQTANAPKSVFEGQTYYSPIACENGLIDGVKTIEEVIRELYQLGKEYEETASKQNTAISIINT